MLKEFGSRIVEFCFDGGVVDLHGDVGIGPIRRAEHERVAVELLSGR